MASIDVEKWEQVMPGAVGQLFEVVRQAERHDQRMDWADIALQASGVLSGIGVVAILSATATHFVDHGAPIEGAGILGGGTLLVITSLITRRRGR